MPKDHAATLQAIPAQPVGQALEGAPAVALQTASGEPWDSTLLSDFKLSSLEQTPADVSLSDPWEDDFRHYLLRNRRLSVVIGADNRVQVQQPATEFPYTSIGQLTYVDTNTSGSYLCTGALFSERHLLTVAHCVYDDVLDVFHSDWTFAPARTETSSPFGEVDYAFCDIFVNQYESDSRDWDVAVITLAQPIGVRTGWMGIKSLPPPGVCDPAPFSLPSMELVGYPVQASSVHTQWASFCSLQVANGCDHSASEHTCDTNVGNSGSPMFDISSPDRTEWFIRAVHFAGLLDKTDNLAIPIDDDIFSWMECYRQNRPSCMADAIAGNL